MTSPSEPDPAQVGQMLAERREGLDLTQEALARRVGITSATVSATERGRTSIRRSKRPAWEQALSLAQGTITRAYRDGTPLEAVPDAGRPAQSYADPADELEMALWGLSVPESDRRMMIDALRAHRRRLAQREQQGERTAS